MTNWGAWRRIIVFSALLSVCAGCGSVNGVPQDLSPGIAIKQQEMDALHKELSANVSSTAAKVMTQPGLVGALGGARVKLLKSGVHQVLLPLPQLADGQVPVCFYIRSTPPDVVLEYRLQKREKSNDIVSVRLKGDRNQEVKIEWSAVILVAGKSVLPNPTKPDSYRLSSGCVQSESDQITVLAKELWPETGRAEDYAANVQRFIREMKKAKQPRSLDALGILDSQANGICTANANLALALFRAKGIASRSMAVIPPISQRLEMHRIVEYFDDDKWLTFDPSSLHGEVPMKPWQSVIMTKTTIADENLAMKPRMGAMKGCPYAQELETVGTGVTLWGQDFFWTMAKPIAEFEPNQDAITLAIEAWNRYLEVGTLSQGQIKAGSATNDKELLEALIAK